jgi:hypothetical protein
MTNWMRRLRRCSLVLSFLPVSLVSVHPSASHWREPQKPESTLRTAVRSAKARGKSSISVPVMFEFATAGDPSIQLKDTSVVRAKAIKPRALVTLEPLVYNWHVLQVVSWMRRTTSTECEASRPRDLTLDPTQIALRTAGGTATVDGVSVTIEAPQFDIPWRTGKEYLLVLATCPDGAAFLPYGPFGVFKVAADGTLSTDADPSDLSAKFLELGTVTRVDAYLKQVIRH